MSVQWDSCSPSPGIRVEERAYRRRLHRHLDRLTALKSLLSFLTGFTLHSVTLRASDHLIDPLAVLMICVAAILFREKGRTIR